DHRIDAKESSKYPIASWGAGDPHAIGETKRLHLNTAATFNNQVLDYFNDKQEHCDLLKDLAEDLYLAMFDNIDLEEEDSQYHRGTQPIALKAKQATLLGHNSESDVQDYYEKYMKGVRRPARDSASRVDPLIERVAFAERISSQMLAELGKKARIAEMLIMDQQHRMV
ncbi:hypothetical protein GGI12_005910, partial [Dipsacomyces acuminosporus]